MRRIVSFGPSFILLLTAGVVMLAVPGIIRRLGAERTRATVVLAQQSLDGDDVLERVNRAVRHVAQAVEPSVVHLDVEASDDTSQRFASGSGWVYDDLGHIVTNAHVVAAATEIRVQFNDSRSTRASVVGMDLAGDIAVLQVEPGPHLIPIRRAESMRVEKGDRVFAFGSPFNFKFSMSEGVVSGLGRSARTATGFVSPANFIQTDAAVNPGNSGGPLVNVRGQLIGMNVAIATAQDARGTSEGQSAGISFAIPLPMIESRVSQIIEGRPVAGGYIGIFFGGDSGGRVRVGRVVDDSPASRAGLRAGDIVTHAQDQPVHEAEQLRGLINSAAPGDSLKLRLLRGEEALDAEVKLGQMPMELASRQYLDAVREELGLVLRESPEGAMIGFVVPGSPAANAELVPGQRITHIAGKPVATAAGVAAELIASGVILGRPTSVSVKWKSDETEHTKTVTLRHDH